MKILIMGLPGSGKTTLAKALARELQCVHFNADEVRKKFDDWDFSHEGRIRQSIRMAQLADECKDAYVICDFIAPLPEMRTNFNADITVWVDTINECRFADTNKAFVPPTNYHFRVTEQNAEKWAVIISRSVGA